VQRNCCGIGWCHGTIVHVACFSLYQRHFVCLWCDPKTRFKGKKVTHHLARRRYDLLGRVTPHALLDLVCIIYDWYTLRRSTVLCCTNAAGLPQLCYNLNHGVGASSYDPPGSSFQTHIGEPRLLIYESEAHALHVTGGRHRSRAASRGVGGVRLSSGQAAAQGRGCE
jgi:hypothetical protein